MKKFFNKIKLWWFMLTGGAKKLEDFLRLHVDDAVSFIQQIKKWVDDPTLDFIIQLSPKKYRDKINEVLAKVEIIIDQVLSGLEIGKECLAKETFKERLACAVDYIRTKSQPEREELYRKIGVAYIQARSVEITPDKKPFPESVARTMLEMQYQVIKAGK